MMKKISLKIVLLVFGFMLTACSSNLAEKDLDKLNIKILDVQSWLNLMPGGPGSFHISGKYQLPEDLNEKEIFLEKIIVFDNEKEIYSLTAELQFITNSPAGVKEFTFSNFYQTKIEPIIMQKESIDVKLVFSINDNLITKYFKSIQLIRAY